MESYLIMHVHLSIPTLNMTLMQISGALSLYIFLLLGTLFPKLVTFLVSVFLTLSKTTLPYLSPLSLVCQSTESLGQKAGAFVGLISFVFFLPGIIASGSNSEDGCFISFAHLKGFCCCFIGELVWYHLLHHCPTALFSTKTSLYVLEFWFAQSLWVGDIFVVFFSYPISNLMNISIFPLSPTHTPIQNKILKCCLLILGIWPV